MILGVPAMSFGHGGRYVPGSASLQPPRLRLRWPLRALHIANTERTIQPLHNNTNNQYLS